MFRKGKKSIPPHKAPWPPGIVVRGVTHPTLGRVLQIRDGAWLTGDVYLAVMGEIVYRHRSQKPGWN